MYAVRSTSPFTVRHPAARIAVALLATAALLTAMLHSAGPQRADALGVSPQVDAPSSYDAQTTCTSRPRPGTVALAHWLLTTYPVTRSMGMMRACSQGARSEHKDGRAFDWGADVARAATKKAAYDFINRVLATDASGAAPGCSSG